ncbi:LysR substrate-binding domain-containing protein [Novosphingobium sp. KCTC 2891]|uniref:LysR substrate-binding domain-containing protein n=1 Tax=Novosphingobium sp. KCTC 2891 TaxID=2989730 RepID=UPI0022238FC6|nr:LysR substrate-binding domain-containing protein [Novosphingobium sp. KCTC 2891]MCW1382434.1 LysR substrate-binding domain-containing protein [Novosphingobium sp. KCTC 2891]
MNDDDPRLLPPLSMLRCFEAAAREGTFSRAAAALGLTQSGVSRQIAHLEDWLGTPLFERHGRRVALNREGRDYRAEIAPALAAIRGATRRLMAPQDHTVTIATLPGFGMRWLAPRLPALSARHPELVVNLVARTDLFDFAAERFDAAIHVGPPDWPGDVVHDALFPEVVIPVIAPSLAQRLAVREAADFARVPLLAQEAMTDAWPRWFAQQGLAMPEGPALPRVSHFLMLAQAAAAGAGAALLPRFLIEPELAAGTLVVPVDRPLAQTRTYSLVHPPRAGRHPDFARFRQWILDEAAASAGG